MFNLTVRTLTDWMTDTGVDVVLVDMIEEYLFAHDKETMSECLRFSNEEYKSLADSTDCLQWDSLLESCVSNNWTRIMKPVLLASGCFLSPR